MNDGNYGQEIARISTGLSSFLAKYFLILVSIVPIVVGIWWIRDAAIQLIYYDGPAIDILGASFLVIAGVIATLVSLFLKRGRKITIYECGAMIRYGIFRELLFHFEAVKGVRTGRIYFHAERFHRRSIGMLLSKKADEALQEAFCRYLVKDLTTENLKEATIYFGKRMWLKDGIFYNKWPFRAIKTLPLNEVGEAVKVESRSGFAISIYSSRNQNFWLMDWVQYIANQMALFWVIDILHSRKLRESIEVVASHNINYFEAQSSHDDVQSADNQVTDFEYLKNRITDIYKLADINELYLFDNIPTKKLKNASKHYLPRLKSNEAIIFLFDSTFFGSGSQGFVLTTRCLYCNEIFVEIPNILLPLQHNKGHDYINIETKAQKDIEIAIVLKKEQFMTLLEMLEKTIRLLNDN